MANHRGHLKRAGLGGEAVALASPCAIRIGLALVTKGSEVSAIQVDQAGRRLTGLIGCRFVGYKGLPAVAVSGGVDSVTLATFAHRTTGSRTEVFHAVSPAVPGEATGRVKWLAANQGWRLRIVDAREFADESYLANPVDRCFFCKTKPLRLHRAPQRSADSGLPISMILGNIGPGSMPPSFIRSATPSGGRHRQTGGRFARS